MKPLSSLKSLWTKGWIFKMLLVLFVPVMLPLIIAFLITRGVIDTERFGSTVKSMVLTVGGLFLLISGIAMAETPSADDVRHYRSSYESCAAEKDALQGEKQQCETELAREKEAGEVAGAQDEQDAEEATDDLPTVSRVIDGDTVALASGERIRYIGIDTPELSGDECYAREAKRKNEELVQDQAVRLEKDVSDTDQYDRLLRYVYVGDTFVQEVLLREGYAQASAYPPDVKYQEQFEQWEREAREAGRGLWGEACADTGGPQPSPVPSPVPSPLPSPIPSPIPSPVPSPVTTNVAPPPTETQTTQTGGSCLYACDGPDRDCSDFSSHNQAQTFFKCCGFTADNDPMRLDAIGVGDGLACESL